MEKRTIPLQFYVAPEEKGRIDEKMGANGIMNMSAYLRKMAIDGYMLSLNIPELQDVIHLLRGVSTIVNHMAKRANAGGAVDDRELSRVREAQEQLWRMMNAILEQLIRVGV